MKGNYPTYPTTLPYIRYNRLPLPRHLRKQRLRPLPNTLLPPLIQQQNSHPERGWQREMYGQNLARARNILQRCDGEPEESHGERKEHSREADTNPASIC